MTAHPTGDILSVEPNCRQKEFWVQTDGHQIVCNSAFLLRNALTTNKSLHTLTVTKYPKHPFRTTVSITHVLPHLIVILTLSL